MSTADAVVTGVAAHPGRLDAAVAINNEDTVRAATRLEGLRVAGPCGAAALAGALRTLLGPNADDRRRHLAVTADSVVVLIVTEGGQGSSALRFTGARPLPASSR